MPLPAREIGRMIGRIVFCWIRHLMCFLQYPINCLRVILGIWSVLSLAETYKYLEKGKHKDTKYSRGVVKSHYYSISLYIFHIWT